MFSTAQRCLVTCCLTGAMLLPLGVGAQQASPVSELGPPSAAECLVEPLTAEEIAMIQATSATPVSGQSSADAAQPMALPDGNPIDDGIRQEIIRTVREVTACAEAGDVARLLALFTDRAAQHLVLSDEPVLVVPGQSPLTEPEVSASPVAAADRTPVIGAAVMLADGRVAALVRTVAPDSYTEVVFFVASPSGDRWLIDETHPAIETPATPEPEIDNQVVLAILSDAAKRLGLPFMDVSVIGIEVKEFPDSSLGCPQDGQFYAQVITPGFQVTVKGRGQVLDYRADTNGNYLLCEVTSS